MARRRKADRPKLTGRGRGLLAVAVISVAGGILGGGSAFVQVGLLGLLILFVARVWCAINIDRVRVRRLLPQTVFSGQDFELELEVVNRKRVLGARDIVVSDRFLPFHERGVAMQSLRPGAVVAERFRTRVVGRGQVTGVGHRVESSFPLDLFRVARRRRGREAMLVYPRPVLPDALLGVSFETSDDEHGAGSLAHPHGELRGVREFHNGDQLKHVVWKAFARTGKLVVREFDRPLPEKYSLVFHSFCPPGKMIWPEAFEHAISMLTGLLFLARDQSVPVDLCGPFSGWRRIDITDPHRLAKPLEMLALASHEPSNDLSALTAALRGLPGTHPVFVVSESPVKFWSDKLPDLGRTVTCLDNTTMKVKRPTLRGFRRVA